MKDILVSLFLVSSVAAGASETAGVTNFMEGENPVSVAVRSIAAGETPFASDSQASRAPAPSNQAVSSMYIAYTEGTGVRARTECSADAPGSGAIAEGTAVQVVRIGGAECPGWALVSAGGTESWVRMTFLNAANPAKQGGSTNISSKNSSGGQVAGKNQGVGGGAANSGNASITGGGTAAPGGASGAPTALPNIGVTKGIGVGNGQGWGQGIGGGQAHSSSGLVAPGNGGGNGQGWGQGIGGGQDHTSSTLPAPGNSGAASSGSDKPK